ncbi:hypothetical protein DPMN_087407 [Dreissena polymorpha]|uniref:Uncharacterized protein n=1 Tax=Dreissena polymorpha TaxID=45954 RepID=A0A9D4KT49_DREPO|nr:hypothetical protein DPMN_087407 [Dreissena polymorpha]
MFRSLTCVCLLLGAYALDPTSTFEYEYHVLAKMVGFDHFKAETAMKVAALENQLQSTQNTLRSASREQSGSTYIRWGKKTCPNITTTSQFHSGQAAGGHYQHTGSAEYICLPIDPEFDTPAVEDKEQQGRSLIYGAEYETDAGTLFGSLHDKDVPCSLC